MKSSRFQFEPQKHEAKSTSSAPNPESLGGKVFVFLKTQGLFETTTTIFAIGAAAAQESERNSAVSAPAAIRQRKSYVFFFPSFFPTLCEELRQ